jgi:hypothetical protein
MYKPGMEEEGIVYIAVNSRYPNEVKIGWTRYPIEKRMKDLTRPSSVLGRFSCYYYVKVKNPYYVEKMVHALFAEYRIQDDREFFTTTPEKAKLALQLIEAHNIQEVELIEEEEEEEIIVIKEPGKRSKHFSFEELGIEIGEYVYYYSKPEIKARVVSINRVEFEDTEYSLSNLTGIIEDWKNVAYQGPLHWAYNGERLTDVRSKKTTSI